MIFYEIMKSKGYDLSGKQFSNKRDLLRIMVAIHFQEIIPINNMN